MNTALYHKLRKIRDDIDNLMVEVMLDGQKERIDARGKRTAKQKPHTPVTIVKEIIRELEREGGMAPVNMVIERAEVHGLSEESVRNAIIILISEAAIFEPIRLSESYRLTQQ